MPLWYGIKCTWTVSDQSHHLYITRQGPSSSIVKWPLGHILDMLRQHRTHIQRKKKVIHWHFPQLIHSRLHVFRKLLELVLVGKLCPFDPRYCITSLSPLSTYAIDNLPFILCSYFLTEINKDMLPDLNILRELHTRAKSHDHEIVTAQKKVSKGRPKTPPKSCSVVTDPQI